MKGRNATSAVVQVQREQDGGDEPNQRRIETWYIYRERNGYWKMYNVPRNRTTRRFLWRPPFLRFSIHADDVCVRATGNCRCDCCGHGRRRVYIPITRPPDTLFDLADLLTQVDADADDDLFEKSPTTVPVANIILTAVHCLRVRAACANKIKW